MERAEAQAASGFVPPMLAAPGALLAERAGGPLKAEKGAWLFEPKLDGLRCVAVRNASSVDLWSRNRLRFNERFPEVARSLLALPADNFTLDGEVVALVGGRPSFSALQEGRTGDVVYWVFDLLWLFGRDVRGLPIEQRKALLERVVPESAHVKCLAPLSGEPADLFQQACRDEWEGLVAKRAGSAYRGGRSPDWMKLKCGCRQELVVGGFTSPKGSRSGFGALLLGYWEEGRLVYAGKVGTGFSDAVLRDLTGKLKRLEQPASPFAMVVKEPGARWVEPVLVAEVAFTNWTTDGRLRHPSFLGLRPDKAAALVGREECRPFPVL
jgi:bifunctional non-homologous end joining protein LigD